MFFSKKSSYDELTLNIISIEHLESVRQGVSMTFNKDFSVSWNVETAEYDDEKAFAMAIAALHEFGFRIISDDEIVQKEIIRLTNNQITGKYR